PANQSDPFRDCGVVELVFIGRTQDVWRSLLSSADRSAGWLLAAAMAAIGLGMELSRIRKLGWRPMAVGLARRSSSAASASRCSPGCPRVTKMICQSKIVLQ